ncbi:hypothetical protein, partial [Escherichia coli]|uniref:hypothetical protein n=1 Tax=Escherichia coli TaxID=562 RepID=UPI00289C70DF
RGVILGRVMLVMSRRREKCNFFFLFVVENLLTPADFLSFFCWQSFAFTRWSAKMPAFPPWDCRRCLLTLWSLLMRNRLRRSKTAN